MEKTPAEIVERMDAIRSEMASLGPVLFGDLSAKKQKYRKKDGTVSLQKAQASFRFAKSKGQQTKRIPAKDEQPVMELIESGRKYIALRNELDRLQTMLTLQQILKKNG